MDNKKIFKVRKKGSDKFLSLGHNQKTNWSVYPSQAIKYNSEVSNNKTQYEVVIFEYELKETNVIELK